MWPAASLPKLTLREVAGLAEAQLLLVRWQLAKWLRPRGSLLDWSADAGPSRPEPGEWMVLKLVGWSVTRAASHGLFRPKCLVRSLAVRQMLARRGIRGAVMRIGVRRDAAGMFEAHAWVEYGGYVCGDSPTHVATFTPVSDRRLVTL